MVFEKLGFKTAAPIWPMLSNYFVNFNLCPSGDFESSVTVMIDDDVAVFLLHSVPRGSIFCGLRIIVSSQPLNHLSDGRNWFVVSG